MFALLDSASGVRLMAYDVPGLDANLAVSPWSAGFGMPTDRFGVTWVLDLAPPTAG